MKARPAVARTAPVLATLALALLGAARAQDGLDLGPVEPEGPRPTPSSAAPVGSRSGANVASVGTGGSSYELRELSVLGTAPANAASDEVVRVRDLDLRPIRTASDLIDTVPGLLTVQHQGGGKAEQIFLRGFDADHGTDVAVFAEGVPVNLRSHAHGQGFADQHFLVPEFVDRVEIKKGPYSADLGDFATAGSARYVFRDELEGDARVLAKAESGSFDTERLVLGLSPLKGLVDAHLLVGGELFYTDGPSDSPDDYFRGNFFAKGSKKVGEDVELSAWVSTLSSHWTASGQIPERAVAEGLVDRFGSLDPTEGGRTSRSNAQVGLTWTPSKSDLVQVRLWGSQEQLQLFNDFHFFELDPVHGDEIEQDDRRWLAGGDFRWEHREAVGPVGVKTTVGLETRSDTIELRLRHVERRTRLETITAVDVTESSTSQFLEVEVEPTKGLRARAAVRGDEFWYTVRDRHEALERIQGSRSDCLPQGKGGIVLGPFATHDPESSTELFASVGSGFHSNDARAVVQSHLVTLPQALGGEVGFRTKAFDRLELAADAFWIDLESELTFAGDDGTLSPSGRTRRIGGEAEVELCLVDRWLWWNADASYAEGRFTRTNLPIPLAPRLLVRSGLRFRTPVGFEAGLSVRVIGRRPLDDRGTVDAPTQTVVDLVLRYVPTFLPNLEVFATVSNLLDAKTTEAIFYDHSQLRGEPAPVNDVHFTPGLPLSVVGGLELKW